jgi:para-nitrobenzyl esterase
MVWLHGGGFTAGSGQELLSYDGENLARRGDVAVVTLNHRLNIFGYLDLSAYGSKYENSANLGMLDIVAALEWVRDNIAAFGGDPGCVTIFGQSGGGSKVCTLLAMPAGKALFHRAIVQSGSMQRARTPDQAAQLTNAVMSQLQLSSSSIEKIHDIPAADLVAAAVAAMSKNSPGASFIDYRQMADTMHWGPVMDGKVLPQHPFDPQTPEISSSIPLMVGSTLNEFTTAINHPELPEMTKAEMITHLQAAFGDRWDAMRVAVRKVYPNATPFDVWSIAASSSVRGAVLNQAQSKAAAHSAPAYRYYFTWQTPVLNGRPMACHCCELAFVFDNTDRCENMTGGGVGARDLAGKVSDAWIRFARTGNPNHPGIPHWPTFNKSTNATMIFDTQCMVKNNLDDGIQQVLLPSDKPIGA